MIAAPGALPAPGLGPAELTLSRLLRRVSGHPEDYTTFGALMAALGLRAHGFALLLIVLPETIPWPLPSASTILGIPLVLVAAHLLLFGEASGIPARVAGLKVPVRTIAAVSRYVLPALEWLERASRPRWSGLARRVRLIAAVCLYLSVVLLLPIPFVNLAPALCLAALALGMIQRDGVFVAIGLAGTVALTGFLIFTADRILALFS